MNLRHDGIANWNDIRRSSGTDVAQIQITFQNEGVKRAPYFRRNYIKIGNFGIERLNSTIPRILKI